MTQYNYDDNVVSESFLVCPTMWYQSLSLITHLLIWRQCGIKVISEISHMTQYDYDAWTYKERLDNAQSPNICIHQK